MEQQQARTATHRLPPQNIEAEQCVLGSILLQSGALGKVLELLGAQDFYREAHQSIFTAFVALFERNEPQDLVTVTAILRDWGKLDQIGGPAYLATLTDIVPVTANISYYANIVRRKSILRQLIQTATEIAGRCFEEQDDIDSLLDETEQRVFEISRAKSEQSFTSLSSIITANFKTVEQLFERKEHITGVSTGFEEFDRMTAGLQPADLIILAGRPSMGKTALAMNMAQNAAITARIPVGVFSLEMSKESLGMRMLCSESRVPSNRLRTGFLQDTDWPKLTRAAGTLSEAPIFIDDTPALSVLEMRAKARRMKTEQNIGLILVDYLQLMRGRTGSAEPRTGDQRDQPIAQGHGQGDQYSGHCPVPAQPQPGKPPQQTAAALGSARIRAPSNRMPISSALFTGMKYTTRRRTIPTAAPPN